MSFERTKGEWENFEDIWNTEEKQVEQFQLKLNDGQIVGAIADDWEILLIRCRRSLGI